MAPNLNIFMHFESMIWGDGIKDLLRNLDFGSVFFAGVTG